MPRIKRLVAPLLAGALIGGGAVVGIDQATDRDATPAAPTPTAPAEPTASPRPPAATDEPPVSRKASPLRTARRVILRQTNRARIAEGQPRLRMRKGLHRTAQRWTRQMAKTTTMSHNPKVGDQIPSGWTTWAENVAYGYAVPDVVGAWLDSPGHYANIMRDVSHLGIGVATSADGTKYYTQVFARY
ncbi:CAP domain-containing protein [Nocardioidaceae bacterium]|nr:CAP domain-containing protein [Nocardioidaceae bacterium]